MMSRDVALAVFRRLRLCATGCRGARHDGHARPPSDQYTDLRWRAQNIVLGGRGPFQLLSRYWADLNVKSNGRPCPAGARALDGWKVVRRRIRFLEWTRARGIRVGEQSETWE